MRSHESELTGQMTDVLDEIIPTIPVDDGMSALVARTGKRIFRATAEGQAGYMALLAAASAEIDTVSRERAALAHLPVVTQQRVGNEYSSLALLADALPTPRAEV